VSRAIIARAPTRLDFGGGWTDVSPYAEEYGSAVCNVAITRYATATVSSGGDVATAPGPRVDDDALVHAALRRAGVAGARAAVTSDFPVGAGLGGSSAAGVAVAGALAALAGAPLDRRALAEWSRRTEVDELGIAGGFQDHYAAAFGGALLLTYDGRVGVEPLTVDDSVGAALERRIILVHTGESRTSALTITAVADACRVGESRVCDALAHMKQLAMEQAAALRAGDLDALGTLVAEHWSYQRVLHPSITTPRIDAIAAAAQRVGALGIKALGASGGGCVMAIARDGGEEELARVLAPLGERLAFAIDRGGFEVIAVLEQDREGGRA
jgi:D-glycero-alpha-D-manno-heptose-7-phosphate kinase